ncbi:MAG: 50S ribosomal protein L25 [Acidimicrobiales bacterium]
MPEITIAAEPDREVGSRPARRLRLAGRVPGVLYGHGMEAVALSVDARDLRHALSTSAGANALLSLRLDGTDHLALAQDIQRHPTKGTVSHVDFLVVGRHEQRSVEVRVVLVGEAEAVRLAGGMVDQEVFSLAIRASVDDIPDSVEVDVSSLRVGDAVRVADLRLPQGVQSETEGDIVVVVAQPPRAEVAAPAPEGEEAAAPAEAGGAGGDGGAEG